MIHFLHPNATAVSGGNIYNTHIIQHAQAAGFPLHPVTVDGAGAGADSARHSGAGAWLLWDSLLSRRLAESAGMITGVRHALLIHYLASENPLLSHGVRAELLALEQRAANAAQAFITTGQGMAEVLRRRHPHLPVFVAEPGVDPLFSSQAAAREPAPDSSCVHLLTVANLLPAKGHLEILAILGRLAATRWCWHIAGDDQADPAYSNRLHREIAAAGLRQRIVLHGRLSQAELARLMRRVQVLLCASHYEAYGMALAEAVATGLPVISTRVGDAERLLRPGGNGLLVEVGDWLGLQHHLESFIAGTTLQAPVTRISPARTWQQAGADFIRACQAMLRMPYA
ncbi:MAG: glycosyltransferase [Methylococcaceae bacterium]|nr:MAG: glycosyltransferase [Methylococcaceae bacterium]